MTRTGDENPVKESVYRFIEGMEYVSVDEAAIERYASDLADESFPLEDWRFPVIPSQQDGLSAVDMVDYFFLANTINFAFNDFDTGEKFAAEYKGEEWRGAFGMFGCLTRQLDSGVPLLEGEYLAQLSLEEVAEIFDPSNGVAMPLLEERHSILNGVGETLVAEYDGRFHTLVEEASDRLYDSGDGIIERLVDAFPSYDDQDAVEGEEVVFYKRAQLAAAMAYGRLCETEAICIEDLDKFTVFADYNLPNVLRYQGVISYEERLSDRIARRDLIEQGSREEVEIRAATVYAAEELRDAVNRYRADSVYGPEMDTKLFMQKEDPETRVHMTETTAY